MNETNILCKRVALHSKPVNAKVYHYGRWYSSLTASSRRPHQWITSKTKSQPLPRTCVRLVHANWHNVEMPLSRARHFFFSSRFRLGLVTEMWLCAARYFREMISPRIRILTSISENCPVACEILAAWFVKRQLVSFWNLRFTEVDLIANSLNCLCTRDVTNCENVKISNLTS